MTKIDNRCNEIFGSTPERVTQSLPLMMINIGFLQEYNTRFSSRGSSPIASVKA